MRIDDHPIVKTYHAKVEEAHAADAAYNAALAAAGFKSRWTTPEAVKRSNPDIAAARARKIVADLESLEWFRKSFKVCHPD